MPLEPGLRAAFDHTVTEADTAAALGSGDVPVLGTPRVLALAERATVRALAGVLDPGTTTVGVHVDLDHLAATPVGVSVRVEAVLERVDGRRLEFGVRVDQGGRTAAAGRVTRAVVDRERFVQAAARDR
jgi:fluoroacetyl-CoA thioesterase